MAHRKTRFRSATNGLALLLSGFALGWMVGLSASAVIQTVLASLVALVVSASAALAGLRSKDTPGSESSSSNSTLEETKIWRPRNNLPVFDPLPVALMVVGLAFGASVGVYARANNWLGARKSSVVEEWEDTGLSPKEITLRVFDSLYPPPSVNSITQESPLPTPTPGSSLDPRIVTTAASSTKSGSAERGGAERDTIRLGVLFSVTLEQCNRLMSIQNEDALRREMASTNDDKLVSLSKTCKDYQCLRAAVSKACAKYK